MDKLEAYKKLASINELGINVTEEIKLLASNNEVPKVVEDFISNNLMTESKKFYENLRKLHNTKGHKLYSNIMNYENLSEVDKLKCLSSYMTSACIAMESLDNVDKLIELRKSLYLENVSKSLYEYYTGINYEGINEALKLLKDKIKSE